MVGELADLLVDARCRRPRGELTSARQAEWQASVRRLVDSQATHSEATTFYHFQILRGRIHGLEGVDPVDLDAFLHGGTSAPTRSLQALRWVSKNAQLQWTLPELRRSKQPIALWVSSKPLVWNHPCSPTWKTGSPACADQVTQGGQRCLANGWLVWGSFAISTCACLPCLRSDPLRHCYCSQGKQAKLRRGFYSCVPSTFSNQFAWATPWLEHFRSLPPVRRKHCGIVFDMRGHSWSRLELVRATQDEFRSVLEDPELLTSYSWRRLGATGFTVPQLAALGDWGDRVSDSQAKKPIHYAGSRYALSRFYKRYAYGVASHLRDHASWEVVPPSAVELACAEAKNEAAVAVERDHTVTCASRVGSN